MLPAARCSIPTARAPKGIALACNSGIRQPAATGQAIILSPSVADDVVASMSPEKAAKLLRWKSPRHSPPLLDGLPDAFDFAVANTAGQFCPAASIRSSGHEYHEPEGDADRNAAGSGMFQPPAPAQSSKEEPAPALAISQERAGGERG